MDKADQVGPAIPDSRTCPEAGLSVRIQLAEHDIVASAGLDVTDIVRLAATRQRVGAALLDRLCSESESQAVLTASDPDDALALAFGLKEAAIKAAGGMPSGGRFKDVDASSLLLAAQTWELSTTGIGRRAPGARQPVMLKDGSLQLPPGTSLPVEVGGELWAAIQRFCGRWLGLRAVAGSVRLDRGTRVTWLVVLAPQTPPPRETSDDRGER